MDEVNPFTIKTLLGANKLSIAFTWALVVARRIYDTRAFGKIRVNLGLSVAQKLAHLPISTRNARLDMSRELVDFLENDIPPLMTAIIQLVAALVILTKPSGSG
ncbi:ABC transporter six-transmembrane domain-containing protein [Motilimonas cestriensis]|uniref:ABC transporter six-transmembrane domain-containing protein n=1 Tax=Motilimonas cestriensis TaxID=2742685 RepID=A0ABS8WI28_9GAMM|nr:ABC transporter six-transmembrane domain-containing protein [Motilimonas cestriensis]MCE2597393.1 ABC transporter six-transmembrane domain-containing protein [Motilimonas cestriensis]